MYVAHDERLATKCVCNVQKDTVPSLLASTCWTLCLQLEQTKFTNTMHAITCQHKTCLQANCEVATLDLSVTAPTCVKKRIVEKYKVVFRPSPPHSGRQACSYVHY